MRPYSPLAANPLNVEEAPPPQELTWDSPIKDLFTSSYNFSEELLAGMPRMIRMYADRWQVNFQESGLPDPEAQTILDIYITVRPVAPAEITIKV
jgi:hypothetical protein